MSSGNGGQHAGPEEGRGEGRAQGLDIGWTVFSYLLAGMAAYGAIGWLIGRAVHVSLLFPIGMLVGLAISIGFIMLPVTGSGERLPQDRDPGGSPPPEATKRR